MRHSKESGTQLVEFAIILPVIIFIALAAAEGSNLFRVYQVVTNSAREGARLAILDHYSPTAQNVKKQRTCTFTNKSLSTTDQVCQDVANYAQNNGLIGSRLQQCGTLTVNVNQGYQASGGNSNYSQVNVVCAYQLQWLPRLPFYSVAKSPNITQTAVFENLY
jgi:Flp pilus assembly protein TadG